MLWRMPSSGVQTFSARSLEPSKQEVFSRDDSETSYESCNDFQEVSGRHKMFLTGSAEAESEHRVVFHDRREYQAEWGFSCVPAKARRRILLPNNDIRKNIFEQTLDHFFDSTHVSVHSLPECFVKSSTLYFHGKTSHLPGGGLMQPLQLPGLPREEIILDLVAGLPVPEES